MLLMVMFFAFMGVARAVTIKLTDADSASAITMHVGDRLRVELPGKPATGFRWEVRMLDASHLEQTAHGLRPDGGGLDAAATQVFAWKALSPGHAEIALAYSRPGDDRTVLPAKRMLMTVDVVTGVLDAPMPPNGDLLASGLRPVGTYRGRLPCGDCLEAMVELTLYGPAELSGAVSGVGLSGASAPAGSSEQSQTGDSPRRLKQQQPVPAAFIQLTRYTGTSEGSRSQVSTGPLKVIHGTYADPSATVYVLDSPDGGSYRVDASHLTLLDAQMLPARSPQGTPIVFEKIPQPASEP